MDDVQYNIDDVYYNIDDIQWCHIYGKTDFIYSIYSTYIRVCICIFSVSTPYSNLLLLNIPDSPLNLKPWNELEKYHSNIVVSMNQDLLFL